MRQSQRDKRNYLIIGLCAVVAIMAVGFAAFSQQLQINSTSEVTSSWCVGFDTSKTNDYVATPGLTGATTPSATMSYSGNTCGSDNLQTGASLSATFKQPGDQVVYTFTIKNASTFNAKLDSISENLTTSNSAIEYELSGASSGDILGPNDTTTLVVTVRYKNSVTSQPEVTTWGLELKLNFSQTNDFTSINETYLYGAKNNKNIFSNTPISDIKNTSEDFRDVANNQLNNSKIFVRYDVDDNIITDASICIVKDNAPFCIYSDKYEDTIALMNKTFDDNTCDYVNNQNGNYYYCFYNGTLIIANENKSSVICDSTDGQHCSGSTCTAIPKGSTNPLVFC